MSDNGRMRLRAFLAWLNRPLTIRKLNAAGTWFWAVMVVPTVLLWHSSILWVAFVSIYANVVSHYTAYLTARVEVREEHIEEHTDEDSSGPR